MQAVLKRDRAAAGQVEMLLRSCIDEVRGNSRLAASLDIMEGLDAMLRQPKQPPRGGADHGATAAQEAWHARNSGAPGSVRASAEMAEAQDEHHSTERGMTDAAPPQSPPAAAAAVDAGRGARGAAVEVSTGVLAADYDGHAASDSSEIAVVGSTLRLSRLAGGATPEDIAAALKPFGAVCIELVRPGEWLVQFEAVGAALQAYLALPAWLERSGYGRARIVFATGLGVDAGVQSLHLPRMRIVAALQSANLCRWKRI
jgi:hypothetical protein